MLKKYRTGYVYFISLSLFCILPFFFLSFFNYPSADDYTMTFVLEKLKFWGAQKYWYLGWSGRYISTAILSLFHPLLFKKILLYQLYPILLFFLSGLGIYSLVSSVIQKTKTEIKLAISSLLFLTFISSQPSMVEGFYWLPGSFIYTLGNIATLFFTASLLSYSRVRSLKYFLLSIFTGIFAIGSNELSLFIVIFITGIFALERIIYSKKIDRMMVSIIGILMVAAAFSLLAPGNSARAEAVVGQLKINEDNHVKDFVFAFRQSFFKASQDVVKFLFLGPLVLISFLSILYSKHLKPDVRYTLHPIIVGIGLIALFVFLYFPFYYGTGGSDLIYFPGRTSNVISFFFIFSWLGWILYFLKWYKFKKGKEIISFDNHIVYRLLSIVFTLFILATGNVFIALKDIRSRDFLAYNQEMKARLQFIEEASADSLVIDSLHFFPRTIYFGDITGEFDNWKNVPYASHYGKKAIRLKTVQDLVR